MSKVVDSDGRVLYEYQPGEGEQRFPEQVARNAAEGMMDVVKNDDLSLPSGQEAAGKTGTVQSRVEGQNNDAWFAGFTPDLVTAVWVGTDRNDPIQDARGQPINGKDLPGQVWQAFMSDAVRSAETVEFPTFRAIGKPPSDEPPNAPEASAAPAPSATPEPSRAAPERPASQPPAPPPPPPPPPPATSAPPRSTSVPDNDSGGGLLGGGSDPDDDQTYG